MKRFVSIWFPDWPLDRLRRQKAAKRRRPSSPSRAQAEGPPPAPPARQPARQPFVLYEAGAGGLRVVAANDQARAAGIAPGLTLSDAKARAAGLASAAIDRAADQAALERLAAWMVRYTPLVALDGPDGLILETTGCDHLFGGERALLETIAAQLMAAGYSHRLGLAGTPVAAAALAHGNPHGRADTRDGARGAILPDGGEADGLEDLPLSALRLAPDTLTLLRRFGLTRIGQLYGIDRKALARRFQSKTVAGQVMTVLDQALGLRPAPLTPLSALPDYAARLPCPEPLLDRDGLSEGLARLTDEVCATLTAHGCGARRFTLTAFRADGTLAACSAQAARPVRQPGHILHLFGERIDQVDPGYGIDLLRLEATRTGPMETGMRVLSGDLAAGAVDAADLAALADRLAARLGTGQGTGLGARAAGSRVLILDPNESHLPEAACRPAPFDGTLPHWPADRPHPAGSGAGGMGPRPLTLLERPEPVEVIAEVPDGPPLRFVWRRVARRVMRADGPERIAPEWWQHLPTKRSRPANTGPDAKPAGTAGAPMGQPLLPLGATAPEGASKAWLVPKMDPRADAVHIQKAHAALEAPPPTPACEPGTPTCPQVPRTRDYYRVEDTAGQRYWLFRDGLYDDGASQTRAPTWYMHGVGP